MAKNLEMTLRPTAEILASAEVAQQVSRAVVEGNAILILDLSCNRQERSLGSRLMVA